MECGGALLRAVHGACSILILKKQAGNLPEDTQCRFEISKTSFRRGSKLYSKAASPKARGEDELRRSPATPLAKKILNQELMNRVYYFFMAIGKAIDLNINYHARRCVGG